MKPALPKNESHFFALRFLDFFVGKFSKLGFSESFIRFSFVGTFGFLTDTCIVYAVHSVANLYISGLCGFFVAATVTWASNRLWTFRAAHRHHPLKQWLKFLSANALGFVFNRGTFFLLVATAPIVVAHPIIGIVCGSFMGLGFNYVSAKRLIFK